MLQILVACSSSSNGNDQIDTGNAISNAVAIAALTGTPNNNETLILAGSTLSVVADVANPTDSSGVSWALEGPGSLTSATSTTVTYVAPASVTGSITPLITATSNASSSQSASLIVRVNGTPVVNAPPVFPGIVGVVYNGVIPVSGGVPPFAWTVVSGALPDGMVLTDSTTGYAGLFGGTPTTAGSYPVQVQTTDTLGNTATVGLTVVVQAAGSCVLSGRYALLVSGFDSSLMTTRAASFAVAADGTLGGISDRKSSGATHAGEPLSGTCVNRAGTGGNNGELRLNAGSDSPLFNFGVTVGLDRGRVMLTNGGTANSASGLFERQDVAAFNLAALAGNYAFGLLGAAGGDARMGLIGQLSINAAGAVTAGRADSNAATALNGATLSGSLSAPDSNGRGLLTLSGGGQNFSLAYYVINANRLLLMNVASEAGAPRLTGFMTRRAAAFDNSALVQPGILSLWGLDPARVPGASVTLARLSNANGGAGTIDLLLDSAGYSVNRLANAVSGAQYNVESDGRATLSFGSGSSARQFTLYLDGSANGYVIERNSAHGNAGLLEAQQTGGPYSRSVDGLLVLGTQFPEGPTPLALVPLGTLVSGLYDFATGNPLAGLVSAQSVFSISSTTGRGLGNVWLPLLSGGPAVLYLVQPSKAVVLRYGSTAVNPAIEWLIY